MQETPSKALSNQAMRRLKDARFDAKNCGGTPCEMSLAIEIKFQQAIQIVPKNSITNLLSNSYTGDLEVALYGATSLFIGDKQFQQLPLVQRAVVLQPR